MYTCMYMYSIDEEHYVCTKCLMVHVHCVTVMGHRNELERVYLEQLQFNINVASSTYAQYYFDLRSLAEDNGLSFPNEYEALTKERAKQLEVGYN